jgi:predicted short-subunit dehydrogenase-like oxidoreductase (DUF2520 family)
MRKAQRQLGLIVEGNSTKSAILRFPGLAETIGPIKALSPAVARRVSNFFRTGISVDSYESLQECESVLIRVPDAGIPRIASEICASSLNIAGMSFILCESWLPSDALGALRSRGATVASVIPVRGNNGRWFAIEGQFVAAKRARRIFHDLEARTVELKPGTKHLYFAASAFAETLPRALFAAAQKALRMSGVTGKHLYALIEEMAQNMIRDLDRGSRGGWSGAPLDCPDQLASKYMSELRRTSPELAALLTEQLRLAEPYSPHRGKHTS